MTERIKELDRLYMAYDAKVQEVASFVVGTDEARKARRRADYAWRKYTAFRDSRKGLRGRPQKVTK